MFFTILGVCLFLGLLVVLFLFEAGVDSQGRLALDRHPFDPVRRWAESQDTILLESEPQADGIDDERRWVEHHVVVYDPALADVKSGRMRFFDDGSVEPAPGLRSHSGPRKKQWEDLIELHTGALPAEAPDAVAAPTRTLDEEVEARLDAVLTSPALRRSFGLTDEPTADELAALRNTLREQVEAIPQEWAAPGQERHQSFAALQRESNEAALGVLAALVDRREDED